MRIIKLANAKFQLGQVVITPGAQTAIGSLDVMLALQRHEQGDWGVVCDEDKQSNDEALIEGNRVLSAYDSVRKVRFWIITEADRSVTTILLPEEY